MIGLTDKYRKGPGWVEKNKKTFICLGNKNLINDLSPL